MDGARYDTDHKQEPMINLTEIEQELWARVYAVEYHRLMARAAECFEPQPDSCHSWKKQDWSVGSALDGNAGAKQAAARADEAVRLLRERAVTCAH